MKKVYETKRSRTVTERSVVLNEEALSELRACVSYYLGGVDDSCLHLFYEALKEV